MFFGVYGLLLTSLDASVNPFHEAEATALAAGANSRCEDSPAPWLDTTCSSSRDRKAGERCMTSGLSSHAARVAWSLPRAFPGRALVLTLPVAAGTDWGSSQIPNPNLRIPISERRDVPATTRYCGQVAAPSKLMIVCDGSVGTSGRRKAKPDAL